MEKETEKESISSLLISKKLIKKNREIGFNYGDSREFDDLNDLCKNDENIGFFGHLKLKKLTIYSGPGWKKCKGVIVGIQSTYYNCLNGMLYHTEKRIGSDKIDSDSTLKLENDEVILKIEVHHQTVVRAITIYTNIGRIFSKGVKEGNIYFEDFSENMDNFILGFFGGVGEHLHFLGIYYANRELFLKHQNYALTVEEVSEKYEKFRIRSTQRIGKYHADTKIFDNQQDMIKNGKSLLQLRISKINIWRGKGFKKINGLVNGMQVFFIDIETGKEYSTPASFGKDDLDKNQPKSFFFEEFEYIETIKIRHHGLVDSISIKTNKFQDIFVGGDGCVKADNFYLYEEENSYLLGFYGGIGGNMHNIGCYYTDIREINYWRKKFFIEIFYTLKKNINIRTKMENQMNTLGHKIWNADKKLFIWGKVLLLDEIEAFKGIMKFF